MGIILIYIDNNFHLNYRLIRFEELSESYTGLYIYNKFVNILNIYSNFNLNNILSITRDNASNNNIFINTFKKAYYKAYNKVFINDIRCVAYIINIIVQNILRDYISNSKSNQNIIEYIDEYIDNEEIQIKLQIRIIL